MRKDADEKAIRDIIDDRSRALYAKNADLAFAHGGSEFVSFDLDPPLARAGDAARDKKGIEGWFATWKGPIGWEVRDVMIHADDHLAFAYGLGHITGTKVEGNDVDLWVRFTNGFRKEGGEWKQIHAHTSTPFYMDGSNRAALDLKP
ncbi:MAG TPA: nuclear transport factor 2 family protein [Rhizomicrobium sp.]|jgi:PhnB protein|nr:nuclear transport factor 2 family protein [Rhizomicrobium sp.]